MLARTAHRNMDNLREIIAALMCSPLYFELDTGERLALVKSVAGGCSSTDRGWFYLA